MSTMQGFHQSLNATTASKDAYISKLAALTKVGRDELSELVSKIDWQTWVEETSVQAAAA